MVDIKNKLLGLPMCPGVYLMKDSQGEIIYVGKSKLLKNRVSQYFQSSAKHSPKTQSMVSHIADFEYIITDTESEALALECNLIKKHRPKYNVLLKDDKQYPYIKITANERFPRIYMTRRLEKDGGLYFGPFMTAQSVKEAVEEIRKIFKIRSCKKKIDEKQKTRPCLYYQIGQCSAPCNGRITENDYKESLNGISDIINGNAKSLLDDLTKKMLSASDLLEFEKAASIRDKISHIKSLSEKQKISSTKYDSMDFIGIYQEGDEFCVQIFYYRGGNAVGSEYFTDNNVKIDKKSVLEGCVKQLYFTANYIPGQIYISENIDEKEGIEEWLSELSGHKVNIIVPQKGSKKHIMEMLLKNAQESMCKEHLHKNRNQAYQNRMLVQLSELLNLNHTPTRIESYDISHFSGESAIGVQIVYCNAAPLKSSYRKYNIKSVTKVDDYESTREVIYRRFNEAYKEEDMILSGELTLDKAKFLPLPDLILLDGGKGHVAAIKPLVETFGEKIPIFGMVKDDRHKTKGLTDEKNEYTLDRHSELFNFLTGIQEEVHRFAITSTRKKHTKTNLKSELEEISGVGEATRKKLLKHFKNIKTIKNAEIKELSAVVSPRLAKKIFEYFNKGEGQDERNY